MNDQLSATIIPFPMRGRLVRPVLAPAARPPVLPVPATAARSQPNELAGSAQRLTQALAGLSTALADQRDATHRWKSALEDLAAKMRNLGDVADTQKKSG